jgi:hypothetical protein
MPPGGTTKNENESPPREGCRGGSSPIGRTHPEGYAFCPSPEEIFVGALEKLATSKAAILVLLGGEDLPVSPPCQSCQGGT